MIAVQFAMLLPILLALIGFGVDYSTAARARVHLQVSVDDDALQAARIGPDGASVTITAADTLPSVFGLSVPINVRSTATRRGAVVYLSE